MRSLVLVFIFSILSGCGGGGGASDDGNLYIPDLEVLCDSGSVADCGGTNLPVFVGLTSTLNGESCDDYLHLTTAIERRRLFQASATFSSSKSGNVLTGMADEWVNSTGGSVEALPSGTYEICAFVDSNSDGGIDLNEPVASGTLTVGQFATDLENWSAAFN